MTEKIPKLLERFPQIMDRLSAWDSRYLSSNGRYDFELVLVVINLVFDAYDWGKATGKEDAIRESCSRAGASTSMSKAMSSAKNGKLGGRPRKEKK